MLCRSLNWLVRKDNEPMNSWKKARIFIGWMSDSVLLLFMHVDNSAEWMSENRYHSILPFCVCQKSVVFNFVWCAWNNMSVNLLSTLFYLLKEMYTKLPLSDWVSCEHFFHCDSHGNAFNNTSLDSFHLRCAQMWIRKERQDCGKKFATANEEHLFKQKFMACK